jgi:hypothetical protein
VSRAFLVLALAAHAASGCGGDCTPSWRPVFEAALDRSVLSVWGSRADDVYLVGGGLGVAGRGALALHWNGRAWRELATGREETLFWVWGAPGATDVWMVGERGLVLRWDGASFRVVPSGTSATLYGVWGASAADVWIVGGLPGAGAGLDNDVVLRWNGQALTRDASIPTRGAALFKVWGASAGDVWVSGEIGTLWRHTAQGWRDHASDLGTRASLLTVHGCSASEVYAVGGTDVWRFDGRAWATVRQAPSGANGVSCGSRGVLVAGNAGLKMRYERTLDRWFDDRLAEPWQTDFHGAWVSPDGDLWAAGGNFLLPPSSGNRTGVVGYNGCRPPSGRL